MGVEAGAGCPTFCCLPAGDYPNRLLETVVSLASLCQPPKSVLHPPSPPAFTGVRQLLPPPTD